MTQAVDLAPGDLTLRSDLAAMYLLDARQSSRPLSLVVGLEMALEATQQASAPPAAFHNQALLLEDLFQLDSAELAWREVLARERDPRWRAEARERLDRLLAARRLESLSAHTSEERVWREVLAQLASADAERAHRLVAELEQVVSIAKTSAGADEDTLLLESVTALRRALDGDRPAVWRTLATGHERFERGYLAYQRGDLKAANVDLSAGAELLECHSPFHFWPRFYLACTLQQQERYDESLGSLRRLDAAVADKPYWSLRGYIAWMEGLNRVLLGRPLAAVAHYRRSLTAFERVGEVDNQAAVYALLGESLLNVGRQEEGWTNLHRGLRLGNRIAHPRRAITLFNNASEASRQQGAPRVARLFQRRADRASIALGNAKVAYLSMVSGTLAAAAAGDWRGAEADLAAARRLLEEIGDDNSRRRAGADLALLAAVVDRTATATAKIAHLTEALTVYDELHYQATITIAAHEERSRLLAARGNHAAAAADLRSALELYEQSLIHDADASTRWSLQAAAHRCYQRLTALYLTTGDHDRAFGNVERARQLSLYSDDFRSLLRQGPELDLGLKQVERRLGAGRVLVLVEQVDSDVLLWIVRGDGSRFLRRRRVPALQRQVSDLVQALRRGAPASEVSERSRGLYGILLADALRDARPGDLLVLVPSRELFDLPVAALMTERGEPLGNERAIVVAPSVEVYLRGLERQSAAQPARPPRALVLSNPSHDLTAWTGLPRLAGATEEGVAVAALYSSPVHAEGVAATRSVLLREAPRADVIHFAGHAVVSPQRPDRALLLLARGSGEDDGAFYQHEIYSLALPRSPVVVLGACETASLVGETGEARSSLAHAFLAAGASAVVGALWQVDDQTAARLMTDLHRGLREGMAPERALQRAQASYLADEQLRRRDAWGWAAFYVIGASPAP